MAIARARFHVSLSKGVSRHDLHDALTGYLGLRDVEMFGTCISRIGTTNQSLRHRTASYQYAADGPDLNEAEFDLPNEEAEILRTSKNVAHIFIEDIGSTVVFSFKEVSAPLKKSGSVSDAHTAFTVGEVAVLAQQKQNGNWIGSHQLHQVGERVPEVVANRSELQESERSGIGNRQLQQCLLPDANVGLGSRETSIERGAFSWWNVGDARPCENTDLSKDVSIFTSGVRTADSKNSSPHTTDNMVAQTRNLHLDLKRVPVSPRQGWRIDSSPREDVSDHPFANRIKEPSVNNLERVPVSPRPRWRLDSSPREDVSDHPLANIIQEPCDDSGLDKLLGDGLLGNKRPAGLDQHPIVKNASRQCQTCHNDCAIQ